MAEETNLVLLCFDTMAGSCFWAAFFLSCDKFHQFLLDFFFNFWEEEHSWLLLGGDFFSHITVSNNSLFSDLAQTAPMTGRALSPQHDSQSPGHPAKADLSFMGVLGLVLKWRLLKGSRKEKERNQFPGKAEAWCWRRKRYWLPKWNGSEEREKQPAPKRGCDQLMKEEQLGVQENRSQVER